MKSNLDKLDQLTSGKSSGWLEKANQRNSNESWLNVSKKIALKVLRTLRERQMTQKDLADKMKVSPQYITKIVKGSENLSLETIYTLGYILEIDILSSIKTYQHYVHELGTVEIGGLIIEYKSYNSNDFLKIPSEPLSNVADILSTPYAHAGSYSDGEIEWCGQMIA